MPDISGALRLLGEFSNLQFMNVFHLLNRQRVYFTEEHALDVAKSDPKKLL